jgi:hypothetical protein
MEYTWRVYINGVLSFNYTAANTVDNVVLNNNLIGTSNWNSDPAFNGLLDEFRTYTRELSAQEVSDLYQWRGGPGLCTPCEPGSYSVTAGLSACTLCPAGTYGSACGLTACANCPPGNYSSLPGQTACAACASGKYRSAPGGDGECACSHCAAGSFSTDTGATACAACLVGTYAGPRTAACGLIGSYQFEPGSFASDSASGQLGATLLTPGGPGVAYSACQPAGRFYAELRLRPAHPYDDSLWPQDRFPRALSRSAARNRISASRPWAARAATASNSSRATAPLSRPGNSSSQVPAITPW